jgi:hypothetical protein
LTESGKIEIRYIIHINEIPMKLRTTHNDPKRGSREPNVLAHKGDAYSMHDAHRLEGKVKNVGIKNVGHQKKKSPSK